MSDVDQPHFGDALGQLIHFHHVRLIGVVVPARRLLRRSVYGREFQGFNVNRKWGLNSNAKRPSPQREGEGLMTHRENRTAHHHKSTSGSFKPCPIKATLASLSLRVMERDAELQKSQDEAGVEMLV